MSVVAVNGRWVVKRSLIPFRLPMHRPDEPPGGDVGSGSKALF